MKTITQNSIEYELYKQHKARPWINLCYFISAASFVVTIILRDTNLFTLASEDIVSWLIFISLSTYGLSCVIMDEVTRAFDISHIAVFDNNDTFTIQNTNTNQIVSTYSKQQYAVDKELQSLIIYPI